jgi:signal transduction histidine kinase
MNSILQYFNNKSFTTKLSFYFFLTGTLSLSIISIFIYQVVKQSLLERTTEQLLSVNVLKKRSIEELFNEIRYVIKNDRNQILTDPLVFPEHEGISDDISHMFEGYFIIDDSLKLLYGSCPKNLMDERDALFRDTIFLETIHNVAPGEYKLFDIEPFVFSIELNMVVVQKVKVHHKYYTYLYFVLPEKINHIVEVRAGLGETGETYLVGDNMHMRTNSRFIKNPTQPIIVNTKAVTEIIKDSVYINTIKDYRNVDVISVSSNINDKDITWRIISEIDSKEAMIPVYKLRNQLILITISVSGLLGLLALMLTYQVSNPIIKVNDLIIKLAQGLTVEPLIVDQSSREVKLLYNAINELILAINNTINFAEDIGKGNLNTTYKPLSPYDKLGAALLLMRNNLIESKEKEDALTRQKSQALIEGQERERERISRDLHDGIGQLLTALRLQIGLIENMDESKRHELISILDDTIIEVRRISNNSMPSVLIDFGLEAGLKHLIDYINKLTPNVNIQLFYINDAKEHKSPYEIRINLYRIAQEAINNALKYANATEISVSVFRDDTSIRMQIMDNGIGIKNEDIGKGKGIINMKERATMLNGVFQIESSSTEGTSLNIEIPVKYE